MYKPSVKCEEEKSSRRDVQGFDKLKEGVNHEFTNPDYSPPRTETLHVTLSRPLMTFRRVQILVKSKSLT